MKPKKAREVEPSRFLPASPEEFIGPAKARVETLLAKTARMKDEGGFLRVLLYGPPGVGKTRIAEAVAASLAGSSTDIERINGRNLKEDVARTWLRDLAYMNMFGWRVKVVNEVDLATQVAQDLMLDWLDGITTNPRCNTAIIASSNLDLRNLTERFQTRFQTIKIDCPSTEDIASLLMRRWKIERQAATAIAVGSGGNVRAALLDAESYMDERSK